jgi:Uma2 family endonuclease
MAETPVHGNAMIVLLQALQDLFGDRTDMYMGINMFVYYERGNPQRKVSPDVYLAKGVRGNHVRRSFRTWEEGTVPTVVFEISSEDTFRIDLTDKRELYASLGVSEYYLFDPDDRYLDPQLQGLRLKKGVYVPIAPGKDGSLTSRELGFRLIAEGTLLRLLELKTGRPVPTRAERIEQEEQRLKQVRQRARQEKKHANQEKARADQEKKRADQLAAEVARLRARLPPDNSRE